MFANLNKVIVFAAMWFTLSVAPVWRHLFWHRKWSARAEIFSLGGPLVNEHPQNSVCLEKKKDVFDAFLVDWSPRNLQGSWKTLGDGHIFRQTTARFARAKLWGPRMLSCPQRKNVASSYLNPKRTASHCSLVAVLFPLVCEGLSVIAADTEEQKSDPVRIL